MISKFVFGEPFCTESVVCFPEAAAVYKNLPEKFPYGSIMVSKDFKFEYQLKTNDRIYGLGETLGGINKRGKIYESWCSDDPVHTEEKKSLYGAHNFIVIHSDEDKKTFGLYFDYPGKLIIDAAYTKNDLLSVCADEPHIDLYLIEPEKENERKILSVVEQFRAIIGKSYVPPLWAFGFMQSRWGYGSEDDLLRVYENYNKLGIPLDAIFLDIDYMDEFRDFSINGKNFKDFRKAINDFRKKNIHIVPIIDAGIKAETESEIDKEGIKNDFFCKKADGKFFAAGVWPGLSHFTDFLNPAAREWFGSKYMPLINDGIDGFWNDMNEPALFYSEDGIKSGYKKIKELIDNENPNVFSTWEVKDVVLGLQNSMDDYRSFYHRVPEKLAGALAEKDSGVKNGLVLVRHDKIHNMYGYNMTRAASEYFEKHVKEKILMISRASYIGMHRFSGIWTGDNSSWWSHILLLLRQLPSLNMCGFLYIGCDLGGFGCNTSRDLLLRYLSIGIFTPLMRNHSALGTREQECYQFENPEDFRGIICLRYRLLPYLHELFGKCAEEGKMYFKPLSFDYPDDEIAPSIEDQLMIGDDIMIAPVYTQNVSGRTVYLPEDMTMISCGLGSGLDCGEPEKQELKKGVHFVDVPLNKIVFFIKKGHKIPVTEPALSTAELDLSKKIWW
ncbi:MAG: alpha-glucosidase [Treponema sp.]|nr:alpha-glucosidase [Treponema sp.]